MTRGWRMLDLVIALAIVLGLCGLALVLRDRHVAGRAVVVDGDTLVLDGQRVRLRGIDAPELRQTCQRGQSTYRCGIEARTGLRTLIGPDEVTCAMRGLDRYARQLGTCTVRGDDIGATMVRRGLAVAYGAYEAEEREAREGARGIWAGPFERPQAWRRRHAAATAEP